MSEAVAKAKPDELKSDPWSLDNLRLTQSFDETVGVIKKLTVVPVRKPGRQEFVQVRTGDEWRLDTAILDHREESESYLVHPDLWSFLSDDVTFRRLVVTINRQNVIAIWPLKLPGSDGRLDAWSRSALDAAQEAETAWVKLQSNRSLGAYDIYRGSDDLPSPKWPEDYAFQDLLNLAFRDYRIDSLEHPVIQRLHGKT